jgi:WD40 repeat protein
MRVWRGHPYALSGAVFNPNGRYVVTTSYDYSVHLWDVNSGEQVERWGDDAVKAIVVAFDPVGELIACVTAEQTIEIRNFDTGMILYTLLGHTTQILSVDFSPTEPILASSDWDGTIKLWDLHHGVCLDTLRSPGPYAGMNISGITGITEAQKAALKTLGAVEEDQENFPRSYSHSFLMR